MGCLWGSDTPTLDGPKAKLSDICVCVLATLPCRDLLPRAPGQSGECPS